MRVIVVLIAAAYLGAGCDGVFGLTKIRTPDDGVDAAIADVSVDSPPCAQPVGHDEDNDNLDDACDPCPFSPANDGDGDGDGIALACDPDPAVKNVRLLFEGFGPTSNAELDDATIVNDAMHVSLPTLSYAGFKWGQADVNAVWVIASASVGATNTTASYREIGFVFDMDPAPTNSDVGTFCVLGKAGASEYVQAYASPESSSDVVLDSNPAPFSITTFSSGTMRAYYDRTKNPQVGCTFAMGALQGSAAGSRTDAFTPGRFGIYVDDVEADIRYVFIVSRP